MFNFRLKQKKLEDFRNQKKNSLGVSNNFLSWYLKEWKRKNLLKRKVQNNYNSIPVIQLDSFLALKNVMHGCSTRQGGVSCGAFKSLNLGFNNGDRRDNVLENQQRFCKAMGIDIKKIVQLVQIHNNNVEYITRPAIIPDTDAVITDQYGLILSVKTADCLPVLLYDPDKPATGIIHAGWRSMEWKTPSV